MSARRKGPSAGAKTVAPEAGGAVEKKDALTVREGDVSNVGSIKTAARALLRAVADGDPTALRRATYLAAAILNLDVERAEAIAKHRGATTERSPK